MHDPGRRDVAHITVTLGYLILKTPASPFIPSLMRLVFLFALGAFLVPVQAQAQQLPRLSVSEIATGDLGNGRFVDF